MYKKTDSVGSVTVGIYSVNQGAIYPCNKITNTLNTQTIFHITFKTQLNIIVNYQINLE